MRKSCGQCRHYKVNRYLESICTLTGKNVGYLWPGEDSCFEPLSLPKPPTNDNKVEPNDNKLKPEAMETPDKKICKCCGRELTIEHFQPNPRCKDGHLDTCKECMNAKRAASHEAKKNGTPAPAPETTDIKQEQIREISKRGLVHDIDPLFPFAKFRDVELVEELRSRGWTVTCTKVIEL